MSTALIGMICGGFGLLAFFIAGVVVLVLGIRSRRKGEESVSWPAAEGVITRTWVDEDTSTDAEGYTTTSYTPKVEYQYQIGGNTFTSTKVSFSYDRSYGRRSKAEAALETYPADSQVQVFYNPGNPEEAVLERGKKGTMLGIILGILFMLISICTGCILLYVLVLNS